MAKYWAEALANQSEDSDLQSKFAPLAKELDTNEDTVIQQMNEVQGKEVDMGGYYQADEDTLKQVMRPSEVFNQAIASL